MGIIREKCGKCGRTVLPGSLHKLTGSRMRVCHTCKIAADRIQDRVDVYLDAVRGILSSG
jgi:hypothetical protein